MRLPSQRLTPALLLPALLTPAARSAEAPAPRPTSSTSAFRFDPTKWPVGRTLTYTKSNRDGSHAIEVTVAITGPDTVEVLKVENGGRYLAHVSAGFDWSRFSVTRTRSWNRLESGEPNLQAAFALGKDGRFAVEARPARCTSVPGHFPVTVYNFDFIGANLVWPFLKDPLLKAGPLEIGVMDPDFAVLGRGPKPGENFFPYKGTARFRCVGEAEHRGRPCRKYAVDGTAFGGREGTLLVNAATGVWEVFEHPVPDNPAWNDFKFELVSEGTLGPGGWAAFEAAAVARSQAPEPMDGLKAPDLPLPQLLRRGLDAAGEEDWKSAALCLSAFTAANPAVPEAWSNLGDAWYELKHLDESTAAYRKAAELGWQPATMRFYAAQNLGLLGRKEAALEELEAALALGYEQRPKLAEDRSFKAFRDDAHFRKLAGLAPAGDFDRAARWRYDLDFLVSELKRLHVFGLSRPVEAKVDAEAAKLRAEIPALTDAQVAVRLTALLALVGDGHTALLPPVPGQFPFSLGVPLPALKLRPLPLRFYVFPEGPRVVAATPELKRLLGAPVLKVGGVPAWAALDRLRATVSSENPMWALERLPDRLQVPAILQALGLGPSEAEAELTFEVDGKAETLRIPALAADAAPAWVEAKVPALRRNADQPYWAEALPDGTAVVRYTLCKPGKEAPAAFWPRVVKEAEARKAPRFVVDLSANSGGDNGLNKPMVEALRRSAWLNQRGRLYVVIGRATFSAAMNAAADLARETEATFVGEPTGSSPNFAGEAAPVLLPFSGLRAMVSSRWFQGAAPTDRSVWVAPALRVDPSCADWTAGRDAALEAILQQPLP